MRKLASVAVMLTLLLGGCGDSDENDRDAATASVATSTAADAPGHPATAPAATAAPAEPAATPERLSLAEATAQLQIPPAWFDEVQLDYDVETPWGDARGYIRELLGHGDDESLQDAVKLTQLYSDKDDLDIGSEYPMYLFLGGEFAWAVQAFETFLAQKESERDHLDTSSYLYLAACYRHYGEYTKAFGTLNRALARLPDPPWHIVNEAHLNNKMGDLYGDLGYADDAVRHYNIAIELYPTSPQPYENDRLPKHVAAAKAKTAMLSMGRIRPEVMPAGEYTGKALGYKGDVEVKVTVTKGVAIDGVTVLQAGRIGKVEVTHHEDICSNAPDAIPQRIVAAQSLNVDGVTSATVTADAIRVAVYNALKPVGLRRAAPGWDGRPTWADTPPVNYDTARPWSQARADAMDLLSKGTLASRREAMRIAYDYARLEKAPKADFGMILLWGGEPRWATRQLEEALIDAEADGARGPAQLYLTLASCFLAGEDYRRAQTIVARWAERSDTVEPSQDKADEIRMVGETLEMYCHMSDINRLQAAFQQEFRPLVAQVGLGTASQEVFAEAFAAAIEGRHPQWRSLLAGLSGSVSEGDATVAVRQMQRLCTIIAMAQATRLSDATLTDGVYEGVSPGYDGDVTATVTVERGRVGRIDVAHAESMPSDAAVIVPQRIITTRRLHVDGITGATVTSDAIRAATHQAVNKAGLGHRPWREPK